MTTDFDRFQRSARALRDNTISALERSDLGNATDGLEAYRKLLTSIADHNVTLRAAVANGREWDQAMRDLVDVVEVAAASGSTRAWIEVIGWCRRVANEFADRQEVAATSELLRLIEVMWSNELDSEGRARTNRLAALLLRVSEMGAFNIRRTTDPSLAAEVDVVVARSLVNVTKAAIDLGDAETAVLATRYIAHGLNDEDQGVLRTECALALFAWILYRVARLHGGSMPAVRSALSELVDPTVGLVIPLTEAVSDRGESQLGWGWWEMQGPEPTKVGTLEMQHFVYLAAILLGRDHPLRG